MNEKPEIKMQSQTSAREFSEVFELGELVSSTQGSKVYRAWHKLLQRTVAVKVIEANEQAVARLRREAKIASSLQHPNIIKVFSFGQMDAGRFYMSMEWIDGGTLGDQLKQAEPFQPAKIKDIFDPILDGMQYAHKMGIVHRDLKPSNIMIDAARQTPVIVDFGIAKSSQAGISSDTITEAGVAVGSPLYASPEQCAVGKVDLRSDIYSLGAIMCELLTGTPPFAGETVMEVMYKHLHEPQQHLEDRLKASEDKVLAGISLKCLQRDPQNRFQSVSELIAAFNSQESILNSMTASEQEHRRWLIPTVTVATLSALVIVTALVCRQTMTSNTTIKAAIQNQTGAEHSTQGEYTRLQDFPAGKERTDATEKLMKRAESKRDGKIATRCAADLIMDDSIRSDSTKLKIIAEAFKRNIKHFKAVASNRDEIKRLINAAGSLQQVGLTEESVNCLDALEPLLRQLGFDKNIMLQWHLARFEALRVLARYDDASKDVAKARSYTSELEICQAPCDLAAATLSLGKKNTGGAIGYLSRTEHIAITRAIDDPRVIADAQIGAAVLMFHITKGKRWQVLLESAEESIKHSKDHKFGTAQRQEFFLNTLRGTMFLHTGDVAQAEASLDRAAKMREDYVELKDPNTFRAENVAFLNLAGELNFVRHNYSEAERLFKLVISKIPKPPKSNFVPDLSRAHWFLGAILLDRGDSKEAENHFKAAVALTGDWQYKFTKPIMKRYIELLQAKGDASAAASLQKNLGK